MNKVLMREIQTLEDRHNTLISTAEEVSQEREKLEAEYESTKQKLEKQSLRLAKQKNSQELKIDSLTSAIQDLELKFSVASEELQEIESTCKEDAFQLSSINGEMPNLKKANQKAIRAMEEQLEEAREDLREEKALERELEKSHRDRMKKLTEEFKEKLEDAQKSFQEKTRRAEDRYNSRAQPLLFRVQCLESEIREAENKVLMKPKELEALRKKYGKLVDKFSKLSTSRLLHESTLLMKSLEGALEFLLQHPQYVTGDVVLGVLLANSNLQWIHDRLKPHLVSTSWVYEQLELLLRQCNSITTFPKSGNYGLLKESLWKGAAGDLKYGFLKQDDDFLLPDFDSCESIDGYMMKGTPKDSDYCIEELLSSKCKVSEFCWLSESNRAPHSGYKTSHRLLYFQLAFKMKCQELNPNLFSQINNTKHKLCQQMLSEATALFHKPTISLTSDLFMEQISLCGLEGHLEFAAQPWRDLVRTWQEYNGCFGFSNCSTVTLRRNSSMFYMKRTDSIVDGCHTHVTAVAVSALAFFLRVTLNAVFSVP